MAFTRVSGYRDLLQDLQSFLTPSVKAIIVEGSRGSGKTTLLEKLSEELIPTSELTIYQTFGSRKKLGLADSQVDLPTTALMVLDVIRQAKIYEPTLIDRNYLSSMVFNGWTHGRLTLARKLWKETEAIHILIETEPPLLEEISKNRQDLTLLDLVREERLFQECADLAIRDLPQIRYLRGLTR